jgi:DNA (cytosine-5)-methyltransferase 1
MNYYNEFDKSAAEWIRELIKDQLIPDGVVDERDIREVAPTDLVGFTQCHFFAGIAGWSLALDLAGWDRSRPAWTGSCPCQPYSNAGKQLGDKDPRNLWPEFYRLIEQCRPECVFGEQVPAAIGKGWLDGISADLERASYTVGACVLGAHSVGAPHIRQRLYWMAKSESVKQQRGGQPGYRIETNGKGRADESPSARGFREPCRLAFTNGGITSDEHLQRGGQQRFEPEDSSFARGVFHPASNGRRDRRPQPIRGSTSSGCLVGGLGDSDGSRLVEQCGAVAVREKQPPTELRGNARNSVGGFWSRFDLIHCRDNKTRRIEPGTFPLAHGIPGRVGLLRGYGNAINPQTAAIFIKAAIETEVN